MVLRWQNERTRRERAALRRSRLEVFQTFFGTPRRWNWQGSAPSFGRAGAAKRAP